jgi:hypothetical protein
VTRAAFCFLVLCLLVSPVLAADITITAAQKEYYFLTGQPVTIPLTTASSYPGTITGTLQLSIDEQLQKAGTVMVRTENRVSARDIPPGTSSLNNPIGTYGAPKGLRVHVTFDYRDPAMVHVVLPEIIIHVVAAPEQVRNAESPVKSTSGPGTGNVPTSSSVTIAEETVSVRQQMGSDTGGSPGQGGPGGLNATALQEQQREQDEFSDRLSHDPLFDLVNRSLALQGFTLRSMDARPSANDTGTFSAVYGKGTDGQVVIGGSMEAGIVSGVNGQSNTAINSTPALDANPTIASFDRELSAQGFRMTETLFDRTLPNTTLNISYTDLGGRKAFINATDSRGNVTRVSMEVEPPGSLPAIVIFVGTGLAAISGWLLYRRSVRRSLSKARVTVPVPEPDPTPVVIGHLSAAQEAYAEGRFPEAYGLAARALRSTILPRSGSGAGMTNTEFLAFLRDSSACDLQRIEAILSRCSEVEFAKGKPDAAEFTSFIETIRGMVSGR